MSIDIRFSVLVPVSPWRLRGVAHVGDQAVDLPTTGECSATVVFGMTGITRAYEGTFRVRGNWLTANLQRERRKRRKRRRKLRLAPGAA